MTNTHIIKVITSVLTIKKAPIALKVWKEEPATVPRYEGNAFPGMCTQIAEVLAIGKTFQTNRDQCFCTGGVLATGVVSPLTEQERREVIEVHLSISKGYKDVPTAICYDHAMDKSIPPVPEKNA
ncbi:MAG: DUF169 domain-containing protein, partial [Pseudomonadota bacterium]